MKSIILSLFFFTFFYTINGQVEKFMLQDLQAMESANINAFLLNFPNVQIDDNLNNMALHESQRLAQVK
jgi:hypothetical protein